MPSFRSVFIAVVVATGLVLAAVLVNRERPAEEVQEPTADLVKATGKCASCHRRETAAIVEEFERSHHAEEGVNCLDCHRPTPEQDSVDHRGFVMAEDVTSGNCAQCHSDQYRQFLRSRHAAPAFAAVRGSEPFTEEQIEFAEQYHPGAVDREANKLAQLEGEAAITSGCESCHSIGEPNPDGTIGNCTECHSRHSTSIALARTPRTCGQCHMGPDHAQIEIYEESKHGVLFEAREDEMNMSAPPEELRVEDMPVPTCATCHMSGIGDLGVTHDVTERLSYWLFAPVSERRPTYQRGRTEMRQVCSQCHTEGHTDQFFTEAESVLVATNRKVAEGQELMQGLRDDGYLTPAPFDEPIEFTYFDFWHYYGRTAKHGAFMGGADFVQWHGNYELLLKMVKMRKMAKEIRAGEPVRSADAGPPEAGEGRRAPSSPAEGGEASGPGETTGETDAGADSDGRD
jgi:formate-dependent nitrite reductase cytochrome c552 subunit